VVVTGGGGYLGACLTIELLEAGHHVLVLDSLLFGIDGIKPFFGHPRFKFLPVNVSKDHTQVAKLVKGYDAVVHLAAIVGEKPCNQYPDLARASNLDATRTMVMACQAASVRRFFFASTCSNYGVQDSSTYVDETRDVSPTSLYSETKIAAEKYIMGHSVDGFQPLILRFATLCGISPMMRFDLLLNELVRDAYVVHKTRIVKPEAWRPFLAVRDAANAISQFLLREGTSGIYNVGLNSNNISKNDLAQLIKSEVGDIEIELMLGGVTERNYRVSFSKLEHTIDTRRWKSLNESIVEIHEALRNGVVKGDEGGHEINPSLSQTKSRPDWKGVTA
jgi:nucleoside-diphosphate-sugar epimerase